MVIISKETLYLPTSLDVKYKAKGWIDMFGGRGAKAAGGFVATFFTNVAMFRYADAIAMIIILLWAAVAYVVGSTHKQLLHTKTIVE